MDALELLKTCFTDLEEQEMMAPDDTNMPQIIQFRHTLNTFERMCFRGEPVDIVAVVKSIKDIKTTYMKHK
jgi:hypothetical protein